MAKLEEFEERTQVIDEDFSGNIGLAARILDSTKEQQLTYNEKDVFPTASVIKVPILVEALKQVELGELSLHEELMLDEEDKVGGSGILQDLSPQIKLKFLDVLKLMIVVSDNTATNMVIDRVGVASMNETMRNLGLEKTISEGKLMVKTEDELQGEESGFKGYSRSTPEELLTILVALYQGKILDKENTNLAIQIMKAQKYVTDMIGRYLPYNPEDSSEKGSRVQIASKSGSITGVRNDIGIIWGPTVTYAVAMMTTNCNDERFYPDNEGQLTVARISEEIFDYYEG